MGPLKILYVDDDEDIREVAELSLQMDSAIDVRVAESAAAALALMAGKDWRPDVFLLDVMMPQMDGPTLLGELRQDPDFAETPAIFVTARVLNDEVERLRALGAAGVIRKPFDPLAFAGEVRRLADRP